MERLTFRGWLLTLTILIVGMGAPVASAQTPPGFTQRVQDIITKAQEARDRGDEETTRRILEEGMQTVGATSTEAFYLYAELGTYYADIGNLARALEIIEKAYSAASNGHMEWALLVRELSLHAALHNKTKVTELSRRLDALMLRLRSSPIWPRNGDFWQTGTAWAKANAFNAAGHLTDAENAYRACLIAAAKVLQAMPDHQGGLFYMVDCTAGVMKAQIATGRLAAAAEMADQLRTAIERMMKVAHRPSIETRVKAVFGQLAMEQGRLDEARQILLDTLEKLEATTASRSSLRLALSLLQLAQLDMLQGRWSEALEWHQRREAKLTAMGKDRGASGTLSPDYAYTLVRMGKADQALEMMQRMVAARSKLFDENSVSLWEIRAYNGVVLAATGRRAEALKEMQTAIPKMLQLMNGERTSAEAGLLRTARMNWLLDAYILLLAEQASAAAAGDAAAAMTAMDEAFRMADLARGSTVQRALAASASRANVSDPALAELARKEQDVQREISSLAESIGNLLSRGRLAEQDKIVADMRSALSGLRQEHTTIQTEITRRFPEYAALLNPQPVGMSAIQKLLKPTEAVVSIYSGSDRTIVWAIPATGRPSFAVVPLSGEQIDLKVKTLREALDPNAEAGGALPKYRFDLSHELYSKLLAPVEAGWRGAQELIVIPHGRLGQLPFGVLTTEPFTATSAKIPYAEMADAPWLIKQIAVSQLPAAIALPALRSASKGQRAERAFVGFGDPVFVAAGPSASSKPANSSATRSIKRRNLVLSAAKPTAAATDASPQINPQINFGLLPSLPDTALEIEEVAAALSADNARDVFLRHRASENVVKKTDLSNYRVVMFATHGLMSGEMPGVYQPALALSNPALTGDGEDGMLTMDEILGLKLKADWVVLSACNSAAAGGQTGESVSGLGRAFFYAGAKSLLVTNWAVETESARMLTTDAFRRQAAEPTLARARALQQSALSLMKKTAGKSYSYAHPMFWAPYSLVGDGG
jgi:CHAT domain-containing protein